MKNRRLIVRVIILGLISALVCGCELVPGAAQKGRIEKFEVRAVAGWNDTGIQIRPGDRLRVSYISGKWSPWPGGAYGPVGSGGDPECDCNVAMGISHAALIGRVGSSQAFYVGDSFDLRLGETGSLWLGINDSRVEDNSGSIEVLVEIN